MLTLYHCAAARSFRVLWTLEEMGLGYTLKMLPFPPRVHQREYLQVNPLGTVPAFFDDDVRMTESSAIAQYLVTRHGPSPLAVTVDEPDYAAWLNWQYFGEATLTFPQTLVLRYSVMEPPERRNPQIADDYAKWFLARLRGVDAVVAQQEYLCAGRFTTADVSVGYALVLARYLGLDARFSPAVAEYFARLQARDGYRRAVDAEQRAAAAQGVAFELGDFIAARE
ncbi:MAG: glutathione S-transferase family protein [Gammaproteobacteria bacterium]|nr:glutathione S-transferase family protein [Gammaproteobacteria bacterium]